VTGSSVSFPVMGTGATIRVSGRALPDAVLSAVRARWERLESRFSLYRADSELSRLASGRITPPDATEELRAAYADAVDWRTRTNGDFTPHRPDGVLDLNGIVKAYALRDAAAELSAAGIDSWLVEIGGDVVSDPLGGAGWTAGIADPSDRVELLTAVPLGDAWTAIATSGTAERGEHVWRSSQLGEFVQVTVLGRDIVCVDVLATAILAGGRPALEHATSRWPVEVLTVDRAGAMLVTPLLGRTIRRAPAAASVGG
jgi:thiamine biosynthesis lipoprotein